MNRLRITITISIIIGTALNSCKKEEVPTITTTEITDITGTTASGGGTITSEGSGTVLARGVCWSINTTPTISDSKSQNGAGAGTFISNLTLLAGGTTYYVRAYASNKAGTGYGMAMSFTTLGTTPVAVTTPATNVLTTTAKLNGTVNPNYLSTVVLFEYGTTQVYGNTITALQSPLNGNSPINVSADITGLIAGTVYHYRVKAVNSLGINYGIDQTFTFKLTDIEGNNYDVVTIGTQLWMKENLKATKYKDGKSITSITDNAVWNSLVSGAYCWYNNDISNKSIYGALYNWHAVNTGKLCPTGWHVPSNSEWTILENYLGGINGLGVKLKEVGTAHWPNPNTGTNESGFTALPGGYRNYDGTFMGVVVSANWFSATEKDARDSWTRSLFSYNTFDSGYYWKTAGFSVRCVKD